MTLLCGVIVVIERILADDDVISDALERATKLFFKVEILPELMGKWFSKAPSFAIARGSATRSS